eukprot:scaffold136899_cov23-Tisochrysis_lutea.AAC.1
MILHSVFRAQFVVLIKVLRYSTCDLCTKLRWPRTLRAMAWTMHIATSTSKRWRKNRHHSNDDSESLWKSWGLLSSSALALRTEAAA